MVKEKLGSEGFVFDVLFVGGGEGKGGEDGSSDVQLIEMNPFKTMSGYRSALFQ